MLELVDLPIVLIPYLNGVCQLEVAVDLCRSIARLLCGFCLSVQLSLIKFDEMTNNKLMCVALHVKAEEMGYTVTTNKSSIAGLVIHQHLNILGQDLILSFTRKTVCT